MILCSKLCNQIWGLYFCINFFNCVKICLYIIQKLDIYVKSWEKYAETKFSFLDNRAGGFPLWRWRRLTNLHWNYKINLVHFQSERRDYYSKNLNFILSLNSKSRGPWLFILNFIIFVYLTNLKSSLNRKILLLVK